MPANEQLHIPMNYAALGPVLLDAARNPFEQIKISSDTVNAHTAQGKILEVVSEMQKKFRAITLVVPYDCRQSMDRLAQNKNLRARVGRAPFFLMDDEGTQVWLMRSREKLKKLIGIYTQDHRDLHCMQKLYFGDLCEQEARALSGLLQCPPGGLVLATGAGLGIENRILDADVRKAGGMVLCHDVVPVLKHFADNGPMRNIPYAILPPHPDFLAPVLKAHEGPKMIVANNLLSVCSFDDIDTLMKTAHEGGAQKVILSQSSAFTPQILFIGDDDHPRTPTWVQLFEEKLKRHIADGDLQENDPGNNSRLVPHQADLTFWSLCWELLRHATDAAAKKYGFDRHRLLLLEHEKIVTRKEVAQQMEYHHDISQAFQNGAFNTETLGPVHEFYSTSTDLSAEQFRKKSLQLVFMFMRSDCPDPEPESTHLSPISELGPEDLLFPPSMRSFDQRFLWIGRGEDDPEGKVRKWTARLTHEIFFEQLTKKKARYPSFDHDNLQRLAEQLQSAYCSLSSCKNPPLNG